MRAIDLYSGIGGWGLGLRLAGVDVVASYEWWDRAAETHHHNLQTPVHQVDIRELPLEHLPPDIDVVVGSPPCTQFSYSNRGGNGDLADGLKDIAKFLEVVDYLKPRFWAMENVPRVAGILRKEIESGGSLRRYASLVSVINVVDISDFGVPQGRKRMLAGSFPVEPFLGYQASIPRRTLGDVLEALSNDPVVDPIYDVKVFQEDLSDHLAEMPLSAEEERMNREAKTYHPVYNRMQFPDATDRPARTVTALCTRVSRESIVIAAPEGNGVRRLTLRERGTLQGFPITYEFFGSTYSDKLKLVGNAIPPPVAYYFAQACIGVAAADVTEPAQSSVAVVAPSERAPSTPPPELRKRYPKQRSYRSALPHLRFGSGMRFELINRTSKTRTTWRVNFFYGTSGDIRSVTLGQRVMANCIDELPDSEKRAVKELLDELGESLQELSGRALQERWTCESDEPPHPFDVVDQLGTMAVAVHERLTSVFETDEAARIVLKHLPVSERQQGKLTANAMWILSGLLVGSFFNTTRAAA